MPKTGRPDLLNLPPVKRHHLASNPPKNATQSYKQAVFEWALRPTPKKEPASVPPGGSEASQANTQNEQVTL